MDLPKYHDLKVFHWSNQSVVNILEEFFEKAFSQKYPLDFNFPFFNFRYFNMLFPANNRKMCL